MDIRAARRIALAAQGIGADRTRTVGMRQVQAAIDTLGLIQIDSVNVVTRAHTMPLFTRLGPYDTALLARATTDTPRRLFEYWGHAASFIDIALYPALEFRRANAYAETWGRMREIIDSDPQLVEAVAAAVAESGPITARGLDFAQHRDRTHWGWNWSAAKTALEWLFWSGRLAVAGRNPQFERVYDVTERVIPAPYIEACQHWIDATPAEREELTHAAHVELVRRAARALGIATARSIADYFRTALAPTKAAIADLAHQGVLVETEVDGINEPMWLWHTAARPRKVTASALVSPFDSLVFERRRLAALFGTDYTIGIYTPPDKRTHGYYVYLFLLDDGFAARTDLKADRATGTLLVQSAWLEPGAAARRERIAGELYAELRRLADWLGLAEIAIADRGDLAGTLVAKSQ